MRTAAVLYDRALSRWLGRNNGDVKTLVAHLAQHDRIIASANVYHEINTLLPAAVSEALRMKIHLYMDPWACASYYMAPADFPVWQLGPGDIGFAEVVLNRAYAYRMDDLHVQRFLCHWLWPRVRQDNPVKLFLDDMDRDRRHWTGTDADKDRVWGSYNGKPGWRDGANWNAERIITIERAAVAMVADGLDGVIVNGASRVQAARMFEAFGHWIRLEQLAAELKKGDVVLIKGLNPDGTWAVTDNDPTYSGYPVGTSFLKVARDASALCQAVDARLSIMYHHTAGESLATCVEVPWGEVLEEAGEVAP